MPDPSQAKRHDDNRGRHLGLRRIRIRGRPSMRFHRVLPAHQRFCPRTSCSAELELRCRCWHVAHGAGGAARSSAAASRVWYSAMMNIFARKGEPVILLCGGMKCATARVHGRRLGTQRFSVHTAPTSLTLGPRGGAPVRVPVRRGRPRRCDSSLRASTFRPTPRAIVARSQGSAPPDPGI